MTKHNQFLDPSIKPHDRSDEPEYAPSMDTHNSLEADATEEEVATGDFTEVTHLYLDRTPEE
ncbi:hypothetical protein [Cohnella sp. WQ 127256]|uniref:hypothetical protein n=1 Tax=Cohnella sp. WQ 127256 TaxID=2938790 RepID=UPI002118D2EA|nr:hypothetical protein [Cohnella sp. WQ 127256]